MKVENIYKSLIIVITATLSFACSNTKGIQNDPMDSVTIKNMIDSLHFVFIPQYVFPMSGRRRDLSSGYDIVISKDTIISYLPFLGRGYTAPISPSDVDFDFTSTKFSYAVTPSKHGWNISIKPRDKMYVQELYFRIYDNAGASLTITSINRSTISYDGYITERRSAKDGKK